MSADELARRTAAQVDTDAAIRANYAEEAEAYRESAALWLPHVMRTDSLGETARRKYLHCLYRAWTAEARAAAVHP